MDRHRAVMLAQLRVAQARGDRAAVLILLARLYAAGDLRKSAAQRGEASPA